MPMRVARFRLNRAVGADAEWALRFTEPARHAARHAGELGPDHTLSLHPFK